MPQYLLDTNIVSYIVRDHSPKLTARIMKTPPDALAVSVITAGELQFGLQKLAPGLRTSAIATRIDKLLSVISTLALPAEAAAHYGQIRSALERKGAPIGGNDLWIAAHALADGLTLVSHNRREFARVPGLIAETWL